VKLQTETDPDKKAMYERMKSRVEIAVTAMETAANNGQDTTDTKQVGACNDGVWFKVELKMHHFQFL